MLIYKQYDQAALDRQYNNRLQVPEYATHLERWEQWSKETEQKYTCIKDIAYGELTRERLDIYPSSKPKSKTLIFIHGGYWRTLDKSMFHFVAKAFHPYDIATVLITYPLAPEFSIDTIVSSCRKAIGWVKQNISAYNGNAEEIYVAGHSAGGHLAVMMMTEAESSIKGVCSMSGLFDLFPIQLSEVNETLQMDRDMALRNSPVQLQPAVASPLLLFVGADETEEYKEQSNELYRSWKEKIPVQLKQLPGLNHYSIVEDLLNNDSLLHRSLVELMKL